MKRRTVSMLLVVVMMFAFMNVTAFATSDPSVSDTTQLQIDSLAGQTLTGVVPLETQTAASPRRSPALLSGTNSSSSMTQQFTGYVTEEYQVLSVGIGLEQGEIVHATLTNPDNPDLNYALALGTMDEDGTISLITSCYLGSYVDPGTGKNLDRSPSYIHEDEEEGEYLVLILGESG